ncbi:MAG TPA: response regulator [Terracidiphilus sp.]|jgi:two-component system chemotaxis response regulator CheY
MESDVLTVDDSATIRKLLQHVLHQSGVSIRDVYEAGDGQEGLPALNSQKINLVLADFNMPKK